MQPTDAPDSNVTQLLQRWGLGDQEAFNRASEVIYPELQQIARAYLQRERADHTLQATALIHEAFLRLSKTGVVEVESRKHFYALAAQLMRQILVDHARAVNAQKRGGGKKPVPLEHAMGASADYAEEFLTIHAALDELRGLSERKARLIELRYFGGLTLEESAEYLEISRATAHREQRLAEAWLAERLARR